MIVTDEAYIRRKLDAHVDEALAHILPERLSPACAAAYAAARAEGDRSGMVSAIAAHYRAKPDPGIGSFGPGPYDPDLCAARAAGHVRVVNIDYDFPDGAIDFLFNPTLEHPPVNHEWLWQLGRHNWWSDLSRAYDATGDERWAAVFTRQMLDWVIQTDCPANWNAAGSGWRTIECGLRLLGPWPCAFNLCRRAAAFTDEALVVMLASMHRQAVHLNAHPTGWNWLMMETNGAYAFGSLYPEFDDAEDIRRTAGGRLTTQLLEQVLPDGFQYELSPDYHAVTFGCAVGLARIAAALGRTDELPEGYMECVRRMINCAVDLSTPALVQPRTNDCYTMHTHLWTDYGRDAFPDDPRYAWISSRRTAGAPPAGETPSRFLPWAGYIAMRADWSADASYLMFDVGPLGQAHMHQDKLNINLWKGSDELIYDDGGGQYEQSAARSYGLSAFDHNTVLVDGLPEARPDPKRSTSPIDAGWITNDVFDYARASYTDGYGRGDNRPAVHTREVRFCRPDFFVLRDTMISSDARPHVYEQRLHLDTLKTERVDDAAGFEGSVLTDFGRTWDLLVLPLPDRSADIPAPVAPDTYAAVSGQTEPCCLGWYVGRNDQNVHPSTTLRRVSPASLSHRFLTLLFPLRRTDSLPSVTQADDGKLTVVWKGQTYEIDPAALNR